MPKHKFTFIYHIGVASVLFLLLTACNKQVVYLHYEEVIEEGWEKNDTVFFLTTAVEESGHYEEEVGIRITSNYPFKSLQLVCDQLLLPSHKHRSDTLTCKMLDDKGKAKGQGVSCYQYLFQLTSIQLNKGDSLRIGIRHNMKREILPGINDVGIRLTRETP